MNNNDSRLYAIYANPEHVHFLISRSPKLSEKNLASIVAESSQRFINQNTLCDNQFAWQEPASAFSVSKPDVDRVCKYILNPVGYDYSKFIPLTNRLSYGVNQPEHHRKVSFSEEYEEFMKFYQKTLQSSTKYKSK